jgi:nucleotide-binding universal stress UspA family protein
LRYAIPLTQQFGATLDLVHVIEPTPFLSDMDNMPLAMSDAEVAQRVAAELSSLARREVPAGVQVNPVVRHGKPYQEITEAAKERNADLVVIATHGRTGLQHTLLGSTAERVVRLAPCPVLVVRDVEPGA